MSGSFENLSAEIKQCTHCEKFLAAGVRPVFQASPKSKILIAGQAPGRRVHESGIPFDDPSGDRLRDWLGISRDEFYDAEKIAIVPMGFCYPGTGKSGDLPPRPECAELWREKLLSHLSQIETTLVIGKYALDWHFEKPPKISLTERVKNWRDTWPEKIPLPHPSPRNNIWLKKNPWFERELIPELRKHVAAILA